jgi:hypothetical protein
MTVEDQAQQSDSEELRIFVSSTLNAIIAGIADVQAEATLRSVTGSGTFGFNPPENVTFDIAVSAKRTGAKRGGLKLEVFSVGANAGADSATENATISRVQFMVPTKFKRDR